MIGVQRVTKEKMVIVESLPFISLQAERNLVMAHLLYRVALRLSRSFMKF